MAIVPLAVRRVVCRHIRRCHIIDVNCDIARLVKGHSYVLPLAIECGWWFFFVVDCCSAGAIDAHDDIVEAAIAVIADVRVIKMCFVLDAKKDTHVGTFDLRYGATKLNVDLAMRECGKIWNGHGSRSPNWFFWNFSRFL